MLQNYFLELEYQRTDRYSCDGASWSTIVEEGEPVDKTGSRATTSTIGAMTSGAGQSILGGGVKKTLKKSKLETHMLHASGLDSGDDESNDDESDEVSKDDDNDDVDSDADEEENKEEYVRTPNSFEFNNDDEEYEELYKDVNTKYEQVKDDEHVILTTVHDTQKTEGPMQSLSVSSDFANQYLNLDNAPPTNTEVVSMMNVKVHHEEPSTQTPPLLNITVTVILETSTATGSTIPQTIPPITPLQQQSTLTPTRSYTADFEKKDKDERKRYIDLVEKSVKDIIKDELEKDLFESYGNVYSLKRDREDKDKYEDPSAGSDQELKEAKDEQGCKSMRAEELVFETTNIKLTQDQGGDLVGRIAQAEKPSLTFDKLMSTPIDFFAYVLNNLKIENLTQECLVRPAFNLLKGTYQGRQVVPANYFINNDLEYLKCGSLSRKYTISTTKTKAAKYDTIEGIEDMVSSLWILVKVAYDKYDMWGITYWVQNDKASMDMSDITGMTPYTAYKNPPGIIYQDKLKRNRLMRSDELYKFCDGLSTIRRVLYDIASSLEMDYLPKRR
ncbi:hypothetical protein Tco_0968519 [Tanacetum coccineum]